MYYQLLGLRVIWRSNSQSVDCQMCTLCYHTRAMWRICIAYCTNTKALAKVPFTSGRLSPLDKNFRFYYFTIVLIIKFKISFKKKFGILSETMLHVFPARDSLGVTMLHVFPARDSLAVTMMHVFPARDSLAVTSVVYLQTLLNLKFRFTNLKQVPLMYNSYITRDRVLSGEFYGQRFQKFIYLHLFSMQSTLLQSWCIDIVLT